MSQTVLVAQSGRAIGSSASRRLRGEGRIPGVLYGHGIAPVHVSVERRDLRVALSGAAGSNTVLDLQVDGESFPAIVKELQRHPVKRTVSHIDFLRVSMHESITVSIPVHLTGEAKAVIADGGLVDSAVDSIDVVTTPTNLPSEILVDITDMQPGDVIRLGDLTLPDGVVAVAEDDLVVVSILHTAAGDAADDVAEAAAASDAEGESAEG